MLLMATALVVVSNGPDLAAQEARRRWEMQRQIRLDKYEQVLPLAMRNSGIDMWIVAVKENHSEPLWKDLGRGYVSGVGYYVFTDRGGDRIERAALGPAGYLIESPVPTTYLRERHPARVREGARSQADRRQHVGRDRAGRWAVGHDAPRISRTSSGRRMRRRLVSAETLVSEFRSRRVAAEIVAFGEASGIAIQLAERALSHEVITPGKTTLEDVAWWLQDRLLERGLGSEFDMPSVYVTGPQGIMATSTSGSFSPAT